MQQARSFILLALLPLLALALYWEGQSYDPGLIDFKLSSRPALLKSFPPEAGDLKQLPGPRWFKKDNLWEYVNGHADYFIGQGFELLTVVEYAPEPGSAWVVAEVYRFDQALAAFGVLMDEKGETARAIDLGKMAFMGQGELSFIQGPFYAKLVALDKRGQLKKLAQAISENLPQAPGTQDLFQGLPKLGKTLSEGFAAEAYRGMGFANQALTRRLEIEGRELEFFLLPKGGQKALAGFQQYLEDAQMKAEKVGSRYKVLDPFEGEWWFWLNQEQALGCFGCLEKDLP
ncbi:MAG: DUF6599 family protein [bacterium]|nr:DUF6599 family protein [bacterium]